MCSCYIWLITVWYCIFNMTLVAKGHPQVITYLCHCALEVKDDFHSRLPSYAGCRPRAWVAQPTDGGPCPLAQCPPSSWPPSWSEDTSSTPDTGQTPDSPHVRPPHFQARSRQQTVDSRKETVDCRQYPILDMKISVRLFVTLVLPPLKSETGWTGELWLKLVLLILEN